jgi:sialate O-acetylesterase
MRLAEIFGDGMVLQAGRPIRIFGRGGGKARVEFCGEIREFDGWASKWQVEFGPMPYGGPYEMKTTVDGRERTLRDVYVGDVFLFSGQSNMQMRLRDTNFPEADYEALPGVRVFTCERMEGGEAYLPTDGWGSPTRENAGGLSALEYLAARRLARGRKTAVGIVGYYQGAADIQCFLPPRAFAEHPEYVIPTEEKFDNAYPWNKADASLYDFAFRSIAPFSFGGVAFYQGERNASEKESALYGDMLECMLREWRCDLGARRATSSTPSARPSLASASPRRSTPSRVAARRLVNSEPFR